MEKKKLRKEILARRNALLDKERHEKSLQIANKVIGLEQFKNANKILLYAHMRSEVETTEIYRESQRQGKDIFYPRVIGEKMEFYLVDEAAEFETSSFGVSEPKAEVSKQFVPNQSDKILVLMPGIVFDEAGNRIGYGGGYYDKYLHWLEDKLQLEKVCKAAVAFECQLVDSGMIENELHDVKVDCVVTEAKVCYAEH